MTEADRYEVLEEIGRGSFGVIRKVRRKSDGYILCRKEISYRKMQPKEKEQLHAELLILKDLRHPNIVAYYEREHLKASSDLHLYMEYCGNGDLGRVIQDFKAKNQSVNEDFVWHIFSQLITALYRCHYGEDPPPVTGEILGPSGDTKPIRPKADYQIILHRDMKPENVFLDAYNSVKLGDFGLSKIVQSNALFAQTYVGTPYYMSPEIYNGERYSRASDVWGLACVIYELCAKEPPFNAQTIQQLTQKITSGAVRPLGHPYSAELQHILSKCLKVNQNMRPTISDLLGHPMVRLSRKMTELDRKGLQLNVERERASKKMEEANKKMEEANEKILGFEAEKQIITQSICDAQRREWEVRARLTIDERTQMETDRLQKTFDFEVNRRVAEQVQKQMAIIKGQDKSPKRSPPRSSTPTMDTSPARKASFSTVNTEVSSDFPSSTDLSELSLHDSPLQQKQRQPLKKSTRTPFTRARTMFDGSPMDVHMDVHMASPSPAAVASLNLSPRRTSAVGVLSSTCGSARGGNIFAAAAISDNRWTATNVCQETPEEGEEDDVPELPSPTLAKETDPFKVLASAQANKRPGFLRHRTAPTGRFNSQPTLLPNVASARPATHPPPPGHAPSSVASLVSATEQRRSAPPPPPPPSSPSRRLSKLPSATGNALTGGREGATPALYNGSPVRKAPPPPPSALATKGGAKAKGEEMIKQVMRNNFTNGLAGGGVQGRTLVELSQGRASPERSASRATLNMVEKGGVGADDVENVRRGGLGRFAATRGEGEREGVPVWDPERDEMPSPFLVRGPRGMLGRVGR